MAEEWLAQESSDDIAVYVVWSPQLGAEERHVPGAAALIADGRVHHYWDAERRVGRLYAPVLGTGSAAWDVWLLFGPGVRWGESVPEPSWWEHQLSGLPEDRRLDVARFAERAAALLDPARRGSPP